MAHMCGCGGMCDGPCDRMVEFCWSRGPRIGSEGVPVCKQEFGHDGPHKPDPEDGWGPITWGDPLMRVVRNSIPR